MGDPATLHDEHHVFEGCRIGEGVTVHRHQIGRVARGDAAESIIAYFSVRTNRITLYDLTGLESDAHMLTHREFHADTTQLVQMLRRGHHGVELDAEGWDRLITWIDLNCPFHGTWTEIAGARCVREAGGEVIVLDGLGAYTPNFENHPAMVLVGDGKTGE